MISVYTQSVQNPANERMCYYVNEARLTNRHFEYCLDCLWQNIHIHGKMFSCFPQLYESEQLKCQALGSCPLSGLDFHLELTPCTGSLKTSCHGCTVVKKERQKRQNYFERGGGEVIRNIEFRTPCCFFSLY